MDLSILISCFKYLSMGIAIGIGVAGPALGLGMELKHVQFMRYWL